MDQPQVLNDIFFLMLFGGTAMAALIACLYLLLTKGNAFSTDVTPPMRLRRWAAAYFAVSFLEHICWLLFYLYSGDTHSVIYGVICVFDCILMMSTIAGTLFAMLQDRKRPIWPILIATIPYMVLLGLSIVFPNSHFLSMALAYILLLFLSFSVYMVLSVKQYGRWLRDNYADLEHKEVMQSYMLIIVFSLFVIFYGFADNTIISYLVEFIGFALYGLLLWRVETIQQLDVVGTQDEEETPEEPVEVAPAGDPSGIGQLLERHCEDAQLYLQHDLSLAQLSQAVGTNHYYLSQYFTQQGLTYNAYINGLRIRHFINLYHEAVATQRSFTAQQLANESGFRSYSTFSAAFKQRMGQTVTAWMRDTAEAEK